MCNVFLIGQGTTKQSHLWSVKLVSTDSLPQILPLKEIMAVFNLQDIILCLPQILERV
jgi:hypothetical protein